MTRLEHLRQQLSALRRRRAVVRSLTALAAPLIALVWLLGALFLIDVLLELSAFQRIFLMAVAAAVLVWVYVRLAAPWLGPAESSIDMALLVERQQQIDSDLVAAMQFESPQAPRWGSVQLEDAVVRYVGQFSRGLNVFAGMDYSAMLQRLLLAAVTVALAAVLTVAMPDHLRIFLSRLALSPQHYPTDTLIQSLEINGQAVSLSPHERPVVRVGYGQAVVFTARCGGEIPENGRVELRSESTGKKNPIVIDRIDSEDDAAMFRGELDRLLDTVTYKLYLGDAWTDPRQIRVIPLPVIQPRLAVKPPTYADTPLVNPQGDTTSLQLAVLESSRIDVAFESSKPLETAQLSVEAGTGQVEYPLQASNDKARQWTLEIAGTPFERVQQPIRFALQVTDVDGLQLEAPLKGYVRLKADRRPQVIGNVVHRVVVPEAAPVIELRVSDDYGIANVEIRIESIRTREKPGVEGTSTQTVTEHTVPVESLLEPTNGRPNGLSLANGGSRKLEKLVYPAGRERLPIVGGFRLSLTPFELEKGDQLRLTITATDFRGKLEGRTAASEPLVLDISDESGVLAALSELDENLEERMTDLIRRELGIGESP